MNVLILIRIQPQRFLHHRPQLQQQHLRQLQQQPLTRIFVTVSIPHIAERLTVKHIHPDVVPFPTILR
jgi:hypothetical protein